MKKLVFLLIAIVIVGVGSGLTTMQEAFFASGTTTYQSSQIAPGTGSETLLAYNEYGLTGIQTAVNADTTGGKTLMSVNEKVNLVPTTPPPPPTGCTHCANCNHCGHNGNCNQCGNHSNCGHGNCGNHDCGNDDNDVSVDPLLFMGMTWAPNTTATLNGVIATDVTTQTAFVNTSGNTGNSYAVVAQTWDGTGISALFNKQYAPNGKTPLPVPLLEPIQWPSNPPAPVAP